MRRNRTVMCLIFVVYEGKIEDVAFSKRSIVKGYVLLPQISPSSKILQVFARNNVRVLENVQDCVYLEQALVNDSLSVEVFEVQFTETYEVGACSSLKDPLKFCVEKGNKRVVNLLLGKDAVFCKGYINFQTYFAQTINQRNLKLLKNLFLYKTDIKYRHPYGGTLLLLAVARGHEQLVKALLNEGASVNIKRRNSSTALHVAALKGNSQMVKLLLQYGGSVCAKRDDGSTPLHIAAFQGHSQIVKLLLQNGARVQARKYDGSTALHSAVLKGHKKIVEDLLLEGASTRSLAKFASSKVSKNYSAMQVAIEKGHAEIVHLLLKHGVNVNTEYSGRTMLQIAVSQGCPRVVQTVLNHCPDLRNKNNRKALCDAVVLENGNRIVKKLLRYGLTLSPESKNEPNILLGALHKNYSGVILQLLKYGVDVNKLSLKVSSLETCAPLHVAAAFSDEHVVRLLLTYGADTKMLSSWSKSTPAKVAISNSNVNVAKILLEEEGDVCNKQNLLAIAVKKGLTEIVKLLVSKGADLNSETDDLGAPLITAIKNDDLKMVKFLVELGADVNFKDSLGEPVLLKVMSPFVPKIFDYFIQNGAFVNFRDFDGYTLLHYTAHFGDKESIEAVLNYGAHMHEIDEDGLSALSEAVMYNASCLRALLDYGFMDVSLLSKTKVCAMFDPVLIRDMTEEIRDFFEYNKEDFEKASTVLARHMIKMDAAGFHHGEEDAMPAWYCKEISKSDFQSLCAAEVTSLKSLKLGCSNISYFDVLLSDIYRLTCLVRNPEIVQALKSRDLEEKLPIFASILSCQLRKGIHRWQLLDEGIKACGTLIGFFPRLPRFLKEKIFNYLSNQEIKIVMAVSAQHNRQQK